MLYFSFLFIFPVLIYHNKNSIGSHGFEQGRSCSIVVDKNRSEPIGIIEHAVLRLENDELSNDSDCRRCTLCHDSLGRNPLGNSLI